MKIVNNDIIKFDKKSNKIKYYFPIRCENDKPHTDLINKLQDYIKKKKDEHKK